MLKKLLLIGLIFNVFSIFCFSQKNSSLQKKVFFRNHTGSYTISVPTRKINDNYTVFYPEGINELVNPINRGIYKLNFSNIFAKYIYNNSITYKIELDKVKADYSKPEFYLNYLSDVNPYSFLKGITQTGSTSAVNTFLGSFFVGTNNNLYPSIDNLRLEDPNDKDLLNSLQLIKFISFNPETGILYLVNKNDIILLEKEDGKYGIENRKGVRQSGLHFDSKDDIELPELNSINCLISDKNGNIWIGADNGLHFYNNESFISFGSRWDLYEKDKNGAEIKNVNDISIESNGIVKFLSNGKVYNYNEEIIKEDSSFLNFDVNFKRMLKTKNQKYFLANNSIYIQNDTSLTVLKASNDSIYSLTGIDDIAVDESELLWFIKEGRLFYVIYNQEQNDFIEMQKKAQIYDFETICNVNDANSAKLINKLTDLEIFTLKYKNDFDYANLVNSKSKECEGKIKNTIANYQNEVIKTFTKSINYQKFIDTFLHNDYADLIKYAKKQEVKLAYEECKIVEELSNFIESESIRKYYSEDYYDYQNKAFLRRFNINYSLKINLNSINEFVNNLLNSKYDYERIILKDSILSLANSAFGKCYESNDYRNFVFFYRNIKEKLSYQDLQLLIDSAKDIEIKLEFDQCSTIEDHKNFIALYLEEERALNYIEKSKYLIYKDDYVNSKTIESLENFINNYKEYDPENLTLKAQEQIVILKQIEVEAAEKIKKQEELEILKQKEYCQSMNGRTVVWKEVVVIEKDEDSGAKFLLKAFGGGALLKINYDVEYTGVVENVIGDDNLKIIVTDGRIVDPYRVSINYINYKERAEYVAARALDKTRVMKCSEVKIKD